MGARSDFLGEWASKREPRACHASMPPTNGLYRSRGSRHHTNSCSPCYFNKGLPLVSEKLAMEKKALLA